MANDCYEVLDPRFKKTFNGNAHLDKLFTGCRWAEGPAYFAGGRYLVWSDIPNNRMLRWTEGLGVDVFRQPSHCSNGNTRDLQGRLVTCEHETRRVTRTELDGSITIIASHTSTNDTSCNTSAWRMPSRPSTSAIVAAR